MFVVMVMDMVNGHGHGYGHGHSPGPGNKWRSHCYICFTNQALVVEKESMLEPLRILQIKFQLTPDPIPARVEERLSSYHGRL